MHSQERELKKAIKLPTLMPWNSKCDDTKDGFDAVEMREGFQTTSKADALPNISSSDRPIVKRVAFEDAIQSIMEANGHKEEKEADLRLPDIHDSASSMSSEDRRFEENSRRNDFSGLDNERGTENHFSKKVDVKENTENSLMKNYEFQRDLRFTQCSKKLSRERYSYFPRFPSPKTMNNRERD